MTKTLRIKLFAIIALAVFSFGISSAQIRITEVMSQSGTGGTEDWFELTNFGTTEIDLNGWKMDDNSFDYNVAVALNGISTIKSGESVIFLEVKSKGGNPEVDVPAFKTFWGSSVNATQVGYYTGSGVGLSSTEDGLIIFDASGTEVTRVSFGAATKGSSFYWTYDASLNVVDNGVVSTEGTINGITTNQVTITSDNGLKNIGSPGTAVINGLVNSNPTNVADDINLWKLIGKSLLFKRVPAQAIEFYSLTGSKVATHAPASSIELELNQGIYIVKIDGRAHKIIVR